MRIGYGRRILAKTVVSQETKAASGKFFCCFLYVSEHPLHFEQTKSIYYTFEMIYLIVDSPDSEKIFIFVITGTIIYLNVECRQKDHARRTVSRTSVQRLFCTICAGLKPHISCKTVETFSLFGDRGHQQASASEPFSYHLLKQKQNVRDKVPFDPLHPLL